MKKWRVVMADFVDGTGGDNLVIGLLFTLLIGTPLILCGVAGLDPIAGVAIGCAFALFCAFVLAQFIGHLREEKYQADCRNHTRSKRRKEKRRNWRGSKDEAPEQAIDNLVTAYFRKH